MNTRSKFRLLRIIPLFSMFLLLFSIHFAEAQVYLSGEIRETTLEDTTYIVTDDVQAWNVTIEPGSVLLFEEGVQFDVYQYFEAAGTVADSIYFMPRFEGEYWGGIDINDYSQVGTMEYCIITGSNSSGIFVHQLAGVDIYNSLITGNTTTSMGGGIYYHGMFSRNIEDCVISNNSNYGIYFDDTTMDLALNNCIIEYNEGGVYCYFSDVIISDCIIQFNSVNGDGGGIYIFGLSIPISRCLIINNYATGNGGGAYADINEGFINCTFVNNEAGEYGGGAYYYSSTTEVNSCIFAYNRGVGGFYSYSMSNQFTEIKYCCFYENDSLSIGRQVPGLEYGILSDINANGDSCDFRYNIFLDPQFADPDGDYSLTINSPCIDAGDPELPHDPDSTIADIGFYYFDYNNAVAGDSHTINQFSPQFFVYPNPVNSRFNLVTDFDLCSFPVRYSLFDVLGRQILTGSSTNPRIPFDVLHLPSGIYYLNVLHSGEQTVLPVTILH